MCFDAYADTVRSTCAILACSWFSFSSAAAMFCEARVGLRPATLEAMVWMECSNCFMPSRSSDSSATLSGRMRSGSFSCSTASADSPLAVTRTRLPWAR